VTGFELESYVPVDEMGAREVAEWRISMDRERVMYFAPPPPQKTPPGSGTHGTHASDGAVTDSTRAQRSMEYK
jgi:hypothetical protein